MRVRMRIPGVLISHEICLFCPQSHAGVPSSWWPVLVLVAGAGRDGTHDEAARAESLRADATIKAVSKKFNTFNDAAYYL